MDSSLDRDILLLFDIDGTLTEPRLRINRQMKKFLESIRERVDIAIVGGSDQSKAEEQLGEDVVVDFDYCFFENGLVAYKDGVLVHKANIVDELGEKRLQKFINFCLRYIADLDIPVKRGTFIEFRSGMLNISPIGRNCTQEERLEFNRYDSEHRVREKFVQRLRHEFVDYDLNFSIGGQISFDVFPRGWDKTYCLNHIPIDHYDQIHFFGDKVMPGGNDYEIYNSSLVHGHYVVGPEDTQRLVGQLLSEILYPHSD